MATTEGFEQEQLRSAEQDQRRRAERTRRFRRRARPLPPGIRDGAPITEGVAVPATKLREGLYRRTLAAADGIVAAAIILVVLPLMSNGTPAAVVLFLVPL